jgi:hypothetical protein
MKNIVASLFTAIEILPGIRNFIAQFCVTFARIVWRYFLIQALLDIHGVILLVVSCALKLMTYSIVLRLQSETHQNNCLQ